MKTWTGPARPNRAASRGYASRQAGRYEDRLVDEAGRFDTEMGGGAPPGDRPLPDQVAGWALILQGLAILFLTGTAIAADRQLGIERVLRLLAAVVLIGTGVALDRSIASARWAGLVVALVVGVGSLGPALGGDPGAWLGIALDGLVVFLVLVHLVGRGGRPRRPAA